MTCLDCYYPQPAGPVAIAVPESTNTKVWRYSLPILIISSIALAVTFILMNYPSASTYFYAISSPIAILSFIAFAISTVKRCQTPNQGV